MTHITDDATSTASAYTPTSDRPAAQPTEAREWTVPQLLGFRFALLYVLLYTFPGPFSELIGIGFLGELYTAMWRKVVPWVGAHLLALAQPVSIRPSGSGDKLFDWLQVLVMLALAVVGAIAWTAAARTKRSHAKLFEAFQLYLRFTLASVLFIYGLDKVIPNQFEVMNPIRLTQYFGEAAPGGFAWSFLGSSVMYTIFAGSCETLAAFLLFFRRTQTLGALAGAATLANVFMLNMSYDIPVKQYSLHLMLMCAGLAALDAPRLWRLLVLHRPAEPRQRLDLFTTPTSRRAAFAVGGLLGTYIIAANLYREINALHQFGRLAPRGPLYGVFEVDEFVKNGVVQVPLMTDASLWRRLSATARGATVRLATDAVVRYRIQVDSLKRTVALTAGDSDHRAFFAYAFPDSTHVVLQGSIGADSVAMKLTRRSEGSFLLVSRGFHWINEAPNFR